MQHTEDSSSKRHVTFGHATSHYTTDYIYTPITLLLLACLRHELEKKHRCQLSTETLRKTNVVSAPEALACAHSSSHSAPPAQEAMHAHQRAAHSAFRLILCSDAVIYSKGRTPSVPQLLDSSTTRPCPLSAALKHTRMLSRHKVARMLPQLAHARDGALPDQCHMRSSSTAILTAVL